MALTKELFVAQRPDPSAVVRRTKEEGPRELSPGLSLGDCVFWRAGLKIRERIRRDGVPKIESLVRNPYSVTWKKMAHFVDKRSNRMADKSISDVMTNLILRPFRAAHVLGCVPGITPRAESLNRFAVNPTGSWARFPWPFLLRPTDYGGQVGPPSRTQPYPLNQTTRRD
jgi:hypothetical protein